MKNYCKTIICTVEKMWSKKNIFQFNYHLIYCKLPFCAVSFDFLLFFAICLASCNLQLVKLLLNGILIYFLFCLLFLWIVKESIKNFLFVDLFGLENRFFGWSFLCMWGRHLILVFKFLEKIREKADENWNAIFNRFLLIW